MSTVVDYFVLYKIIKKLVTPFEKWEAFKLGIIDKQGNVLKKKLTSQNDKKAWTKFDILIRNLKRILAKIPGGNSKLGTFSAALFLLREWNEDDKRVDFLNENLYHEYKKFISEDAPTNSVGTGSIAGVGVGPKGEPGKVIKKIIKRKRKNIPNKDEK